VCRSGKGNKNVSSILVGSISNIYSCINNQRKYINGSINGFFLSWLIDSGSEITLISKTIADNIPCIPFYKPSNLKIQSVSGNNLCVKGECNVNIELNGLKINTDIVVVTGMCEDAILGISVLKQFHSFEIVFGGMLPTLKVASCDVSTKFSDVFDKFTTINISPAPIIVLKYGTIPIRCASRFRSTADNNFIKNEVEALLKSGVIVPSRSPWRSQLVVAKSANGKFRMVVDYSTTINRYTVPDAFPLPLIDDILSQISSWKFFSVIDLKSAYYQVKLLENERELTAFEACGGLFDFSRHRSV